jgi:hypothetical protein
VHDDLRPLGCPQCQLFVKYVADDELDGRAGGHRADVGGVRFHELADSP